MLVAFIDSYLQNKATTIVDQPERPGSPRSGIKARPEATAVPQIDLAKPETCQAGKPAGFAV